MRTKAYITVALLAAAQAIGFAQTFNPKVVITNAYDGKVMEVQKQEFEMAVPDSLSHFDLAFDYSVFDNPYTGSYEFSPYEMCFTPETSPYKSSMLFVRGGLGYTLHPELQAVYTPVLKGKMDLSLYDDFKGYLGKYRNIEAQSAEDGGWNLGENKADPYTGHDLTNRFGVRGIKKGKRNDFGFDASYGLLASGDTLVSHFANSADVKLSLASNYDPSLGIFYYDGSLGLNYMNDRFIDENLSLFGADFKASLGTVFGANSKLVIEFGEQFVKHNGRLSSLAGITSITPSYKWNNKRAAVSIGLSGIINMKGNKNEEFQRNMYAQTAQILTPQVRASFRLVPDYLTVYAYCCGGSEINSYASLLNSHHFINPFDCLRFSQFLDYSVTKMNTGGGFSGSIAGNLQYDVKAGWASYDNAAMDAVALVGQREDGPMRAYIAYADYSAFYTDLNLRWKTSKLEADGFFRYQKTNIMHLDPVLAPAAFRGNLNARYFLSDRLSFGICGEYMSARKGQALVGETATASTYSVPAYIDLGAFADYRLTSRISLWAKAANLLGQNIQRTVLIAEKGASITAGACLNF